MAPRARPGSRSRTSNHAPPASSSGPSHAATARPSARPTKPSNEPVPFASGDVLGGKYRLDRKLGEGGMGAVWEARHLGTGARLAVKVVSPDLAGSRAAREHLLREAVTSNLVDEATRTAVTPPLPTGPGTAPVYDAGVAYRPSANGKRRHAVPYIVMAKMEGQPWGSVADKLRVPVPIALKAATHVLRALERAHAAGLVHRDVKPDNMFLTKGGGTKLLDWGLVQYPGDPPSGLGHPVGTLEFMPPEQGLGLASDPRSDTYATGAALYRLITGRPSVDPMKALAASGAYVDSLSPSLRAQAEAGEIMPPLGRYPTCPVRPIREIAPELREDVAAIIDKALRCPRSERYQTAHAMREDLEQAIQREMLGL